MQRIQILCLIAVFVLVGCDQIEKGNTSDDSKLLSDQEGKYTVYIVSNTENEITFQMLDKNNIYNVKTITQETMESSRLSNVEKTPIFIVYDTKKDVFKTHSVEALMEFLKGKK